MDEFKTNLINVINTLNQIDVRGRENMNRLLGCIMVLEKMVQETNKKEEPSIQIMPMNEEEPDEEHKVK